MSRAIPQMVREQLLRRPERKPLRFGLPRVASPNTTGFRGGSIVSPLDPYYRSARELCSCKGKSAQPATDAVSTASLSPGWSSALVVSQSQFKARRLARLPHGLKVRPLGVSSGSGRGSCSSCERVDNATLGLEAAPQSATGNGIPSLIQRPSEPLFELSWCPSSEEVRIQPGALEVTVESRVELDIGTVKRKMDEKCSKFLEWYAGYLSEDYGCPEMCQSPTNPRSNKLVRCKMAPWTWKRKAPCNCEVWNEGNPEPYQFEDGYWGFRYVGQCVFGESDFEVRCEFCPPVLVVPWRSIWVM